MKNKLIPSLGMEEDIDKPDSPAGVVHEVKEWRKANGKSGFKPE